MRLGERKLRHSALVICISPPALFRVAVAGSLRCSVTLFFLASFLIKCAHILGYAKAMLATRQALSYL